LDGLTTDTADERTEAVEVDGESVWDAVRVRWGCEVAACGVTTGDVVALDIDGTGGTEKGLNDADAELDAELLTLEVPLAVCDFVREGVLLRVGERVGTLLRVAVAV
jgi:hypothetical protein